MFNVKIEVQQLHRIKNADKRATFIVFGWIRKYQSEYFINHDKSSLFSNIPLSIYSICLCYYYATDKFDKNNKSECIILSNDDTCIYYSHGATWQTIFGQRICIRGGVYEWKLKLIKIKEQGYNTWNTIIGVVDDKQNKKKILITSASDITFFNNSYGFIGSQKKSYSRIDHEYQRVEYGEKFEKENDEIIVILDLINNTLSYKINGNDYGVAYKVKSGISYRFAVSLCKGRTLELS